MDSIKDVVRSSVKVPEFDKYLKKAGGHISWNIVEITIKMKTIVWKPLIIETGMFVYNFVSPDVSLFLPQGWCIFVWTCPYVCSKKMYKFLFLVYTTWIKYWANVKFSCYRFLKSQCVLYICFFSFFPPRISSSKFRDVYHIQIITIFNIIIRILW